MGVTLPRSVAQSLIQRKPFLWINDSWLPIRDLRSQSAFSLDQVHDAERRLSRFAPVLARLFPELLGSEGIIESPLLRAPSFQRELMPASYEQGRWFIKADHALPVAGSIKARGGVYEVLVHAEELAIRCGLLQPKSNLLELASQRARDLFAGHRVSVGSTGNLGLSIGIMAAALGFRSTVHMSSDAKGWKKARLRSHGVEVVEHNGDFGTAVSAGRVQSAQDPSSYFVDDENSSHLFFGYSVAALRLAEQLAAQGVSVDARHPLFVYVPCGVGGAPGGICFGLRHLFGDNVHCFFAEPTAAPCVLTRLASEADQPIPVQDIGLDLSTEADGLAVGKASEFAASLLRPLVSGIFTVSDEDLFEDLYLLDRSEGLQVEPSATAGFRGPRWVLASESGHGYLTSHRLWDDLKQATHLLWTTGGALVPREEYANFYERGRGIVEARSRGNT